ncbi:hypothetical protein ES705_42547 [subsurface metagenome]
MVKKDQKYKYEKTLVFNLHAIVVLALKNNHLLYTLDLKGMINLPFYLIGVNYEVLITDYDVYESEIVKTFNYNDPLISTHMSILCESTNDIYGDNINYTITPDNWKRYSMSFQPGRIYDLSFSPVVISESKQNIIFDIYIDPTYTPAGVEFQCTPSFKLFIGTN